MVDVNRFSLTQTVKFRDISINQFREGQIFSLEYRNFGEFDQRVLVGIEVIVLGRPTKFYIDSDMVEEVVPEPPTP
jgi:hypothetical protein